MIEDVRGAALSVEEVFEGVARCEKGRLVVVYERLLLFECCLGVTVVGGGGVEINGAAGALERAGIPRPSGGYSELPKAGRSLLATPLLLPPRGTKVLSSLKSEEEEEVDNPSKPNKEFGEPGGELLFRKRGGGWRGIEASRGEYCS